ncbi:hypothetical protein DID74_00585 [Candidatus Marinamargulisbacteria bacterium SCGC AG-333-B06]|nr:hypothetical protein DID74_00585 [Candidatus Marinamargulisbacteria bacterium SCGC AG-333-B06]
MKKNRITRINHFKSLLNPKILIQRADRLGDLVLALPVIETIRYHYPNASIYVLCSSRNEQLLHHYSVINGFISFDMHRNPSSSEKKNFIKTIKEHQFDLYVALWAEPFLQKLAFLAGIPLSFGPHIGPLSAFYYTQAIPLAWHNIFIHESDFNLQCIGPLNIKPVKSLKIPANLTPNKPVSKILNRIQLINKPTVLFFCSSGKPETSIEETTFLSIASSLCKHHFHVLLTYGNLDSFTSIQHFEHPHLTNITTLLSLNELIQIMHHIDIYFGPDTGPSHIASSLNKKVVLLFKSSNNPPLRWGPLCQQFSIIRFDYLSNSLLKTSLEVTSVISAIKNLYRRPTLFNDAAIKRLHSQTSLRFVWVANNIVQFQSEKAMIRTLQKQGWVIFLHITRPNPYKNIKQLIQKYQQRHINAFFSNSNSIYFFPIRFLLYLNLYPKLVIRSKPIFT